MRLPPGWIGLDIDAHDGATKGGGRATFVLQGETDPSPGADSTHPVALLTFVVGALAAISGGAHLQGVLQTAGVRDYPYNFRYAALLLVGIVIVYAGALCIAAVSGLAARKRAAVPRAVSGLLLLILVSVPLIPIQPELAGGLTFVGTLNLAILRFVRRDFSR